MDTSLSDANGACSTFRIFRSGYSNYRGGFQAIIDLYYCVTYIADNEMQWILHFSDDN